MHYKLLQSPPRCACPYAHLQCSLVPVLCDALRLDGHGNRAFPQWEVVSVVDGEAGVLFTDLFDGCGGLGVGDNL